LAWAPLILPRSVLGANSPGNRITMGFIGVGRQASGANVPRFIALPEVQIVAVCDVIDNDPANKLLIRPPMRAPWKLA
jgi:hypothetical protein